MKIQKRLENKRYAVAQSLGVFIMMIVLFGALYIPLNLAVTQYQNIQQTEFNNNVFDVSTLAFMNSWWTWMPVIIVIVGVEYIFLRAQKRNWGE